jgi:hypothetical protein
MSVANINWGTKGPNAELQLANLFGGCRLKADELYQYALLHVGYHAVRAVQSKAKIRLDPFGCSYHCAATKWQPFRPGALRARAGGCDDTDSDADFDGNESVTGESPLKYPPGLEPWAGDLVTAIREEERAAQAALHLEGGSISGQVVPDESLEQALGQEPAVVRADPLTVLPTPEDETQIGARSAFSRFPPVAEEPANVFNNDPRNLEAANAMRNRGVGDHKPRPSESRAARKVTDTIKRVLCSRENVDACLEGFENYIDALPGKMSGKTRQSIMENVSNEAHFDYVTYSLLIKAFVKAESSKKKKPRPIADHGMERLVPLAKVAWVFEKLMAKVPHSNIKGREKEKALCELFKNFSGIKNLESLIENDLTAFEFGVSEELKAMEAEILRHIASMLRLDGLDLAFERVVDARTQCATWTMSFRDAAGARQKVTIKLPRTMRESGDRLTSSGNWLQNVIAWFSFLCDEESIDEAVTGWVKSKGRNFHYVSARDGEKHLARLGFEGDDTAGGLSEALSQKELEDFFRRWGWSAKIRVVAKTGYDYMEFVGERALMYNSKPVILDNRLISAPGIKRLLHEKPWCTSNMLPKDRPGSLKLYAIRLASQFRSVPSMYAFARAMYQDNKHGLSVDKGALQDFLRASGDVGVVPDLDDFPEPDFSNAEHWTIWTEVTAGKASDLELAQMTGLTSLQQHGFDLQAVVPTAWRLS